MSFWNKEKKDNTPILMEKYELQVNSYNGQVTTICHILVDNKIECYGIARVGHYDNYNREIGKKIAFAHAMRIFVKKNFRSKIQDLTQELPIISEITNET
jgi:hypothetical protein